MVSKTNANTISDSAKSGKAAIVALSEKMAEGLSFRPSDASFALAA